MDWIGLCGQQPRNCRSQFFIFIWTSEAFTARVLSILAVAFCLAFSQFAFCTFSFVDDSRCFWVGLEPVDS